ncbi:GDSL-type esterase/lipase family protein [[Clostridium] symbiosum]|uniref:GDSL-type esterase/lipase family protein n=1 Tax=Clostridium symbiosum TaxID=1512 RepID=UPI001D079B53|nr:GDSL-type esterase/lipase family protein [[Clostridium] symbiosum]MCB6608639.1 GDSL-type esterase/lipase family protein [[Clostridium] symbiosum]MCB6931669.1 GDSL-type esterase/lipase family protein [[Clostridium] symbiosum]
MKILCEGDSLTYGYGQPRTCIWTALCAGITGTELVNRGINGNTTGGMLAVLCRDLERETYDGVLLMGGENDLIYSGDLAGAKANMGAMVHMAFAASSQPVIGTAVLPCPPIKESWRAWADAGETGEKRKEYSLWLREFSRLFRLPVIDFETEFPKRIAQRGCEQREYYMEDGLHPNRAGHEIMAEIAADAILAIQTVRRGRN